MPHTDGDGELKPLVEPRVIRMLKERPRLVDKGFRKEILEELESAIVERRTTDTVSSRIAHELVDMTRDPATQVTKNRVQDTLEKRMD